MTAIIFVEILLLAGMAGFVFWFNTKKYKEMQEWRARKAEIAHLLQERAEAEKEVQELRQTSTEYSDQINAQRLTNSLLAQEEESWKQKIEMCKTHHQEMRDYYEITEEAIREKQEKEREIWFAEYKFQQEQEFLQAQKDFVEQFNMQAKVKLDIGADIAMEVAQLKKTAQAAIEVAKLREATNAQKDFYRLQIDELALEDIQELKEVMKKLNQPEVLGKLIWKVYYEKAYTDLCGRLFTKPVMGIYMITNLKNEMCYVGQAVNIQERWRQHIKRAIGAETPTQNKLYPAMAKFGAENFTFQVIEEITDRNLLDEREDYWQDFYKAKEFGYSIK